MAPWLSVLMPTFNGARWIAAALDSIVQERDPGIEVVVAEGGSTDGTAEVVRRYQQSLPLRLVQQTRAGNWVAGTNTALRAAQGEYACMLHQDDLWLPGRAAAVRDALPCSLLLHPAIFIGPDGRRLGAWRLPLPAGTVASSRFVERLLVQNFVAVPSAVFPRAAVLDGGLDESLWYTADWDLWLRLGARGPVRVLPQPLAAFRVHPGSQTMSRARTTDEFRAQLRRAFDRHFEPWAATVSPRTARRVRAASLFSVEVNVALSAAHQAGTSAGIAALAGRFLLLGAPGWVRYLKNSRLHERVLARLRA